MAEEYQRRWVGITNATDKAQAVRTLAEILTDKDGKAFISRLDSKDAELCVEILGNGIAAEHDLRPAEKQAFFVALRRLAERRGLLPNRMRIADRIEVSDELLTSSGFADLRLGTYRGSPVAVKTLRITARDDFVKIRKRFCKEVVLWSTLSHANILKLVGVQEDIKKRQFAIVSEWMSRRNIIEFIENNHANRLELLYGAAQGLKYLHGVGLTHGNLEVSNILVSNDTPPRACLAGFGFISVVPDRLQKSRSVRLESGKVTFMSPELLIPEEFGKKCAEPTPQSDVYAFALVIFQVLTGEIPFSGILQSALAYHVLRGMRPSKPENASIIGFSDSLWDFTQRCWDGKVESRPKVGEVVVHLRQVASNWDRLMPPHVQAEGIAPGPKETSHSGTWDLFLPSVDDTPGSLTRSPSASESPTTPNTPQLPGQPQRGSQEVVTKPPEEPQHELLVSVHLQSEQPHDHLHVTEIYPHPH